MKKGNKIIGGLACLHILFGLIEWNEYYPESFDKMVNHVKSLGRKVKERFYYTNQKEKEQ